MVDVGLVAGGSAPRARHPRRTNVVLPAPRSPETRTTSPGCSVAARSAASASVSGAEPVSSVVLLGAFGMERAAGGAAGQGRVTDGEAVGPEGMPLGISSG